MSNELTDVRCPCGAEFQADSYDAGFIAGSGMCQNCDAALPPKDICTCPSGDGSLVHPCPAHPAVEQAGGDERAAFFKHLIGRHPAHETEIVRVVEHNHAAWKAWQARAALAQPSPASDLDPLNLAPHAEAFNEAPAEALKPEPAEADRLEVVAWQYRVTAGPQTGWSLWHPGKGEEFERSYTVERRPLMTVAQHERIVGELRAVIAQLRQHKNDYMDSGQETYRALQNEIREREAEIARLDGLVSGRTAERDAALAEVERLRQFEGICGGLPQDAIDGGWTVQGIRAHSKQLEEQLKVALARVAELEKQEPVAHLRASDLERLNQPGIAGSAGSLWNGPREGFVPLYAAPVAQAQHGVPGKYDDVLLPFLKLMEHELHANAGKGDRPGWLQMDRKTALLEIYYHLGKLQKATKDNDAAGIVEYAADVANMSMMLVDVCGLLAAAPGKEGV